MIFSGIQFWKSDPGSEQKQCEALTLLVRSKQIIVEALLITYS
jgi:hypothetical protein